MNIYHLYIILSLLLLFSCERVTDPINLNENLQGGWEETFTWNDYKICISPENDSSNCEITQTSHLTLNGNTFNVEIIPLLNDISEDPDRSYSGKYYSEEQTIIFISDRDSSLHKMIYKCNDDSLELEMLPESINDSIMVIRYSSFLWRNAVGKISGIFHRAI